MKRGYIRHFLYPRKLATFATKENLEKYYVPSANLGRPRGQNFDTETTLKGRLGVVCPCLFCLWAPILSLGSLAVVCLRSHFCSTF